MKNLYPVVVCTHEDRTHIFQELTAGGISEEQFVVVDNSDDLIGFLEPSLGQLMVLNVSTDPKVGFPKWEKIFEDVRNKSPHTNGLLYGSVYPIHEVVPNIQKFLTTGKLA